MARVAGVILRSLREACFCLDTRSSIYSNAKKLNRFSAYGTSNSLGFDIEYLVKTFTMSRTRSQLSLFNYPQQLAKSLYQKQ